MVIRALLLSVTLVAGSVYLSWASRPEEVPIRESLSNVPIQLGPWESREAHPLDARIIAVLGVDDYLNRTYSAPGKGAVGLYVGYYKSQREGNAIHSPLNCLPGSGWNPVRRGIVEIPVYQGKTQGGDVIQVNRIVILKGTDKQVVLYWYQSHGRVVASEYWGKIYTVLDALRTNRTDAALVRVVSPALDLDPRSEQAAEQRGVEFVGLLFPHLVRFLPQ